MKRSVFGVCLTVALLSVGISGCGGGGIDEGMPDPNKKGIPLDPNMVNMTGSSFADQKKSMAKNASAAPAAPAPEEKKE